MTPNRTQQALEDLISAASAATDGISNRHGQDLHRALVAARSAAACPIRVKPLSWRTIDPGFRFIGTGLGFTCEVRRLHKGGWEAVSSAWHWEFPSQEEAKAAAEAAFAGMIWGCLE